MRTCTLCENRVYSGHRLCHQCYKQYKQYLDEPWFRELATLQTKQDEIDFRESYQLEQRPIPLTLHEAELQLTIKKEIGRPKTDWRIIQQILDIYDEDRELVRQGKKEYHISIRNIVRKIHNALGYFGVRAALIRYRPEYNIKKRKTYNSK